MKRLKSGKRANSKDSGLSSEKPGKENDVSSSGFPTSGDQWENSEGAPLLS